jgi:hypothetical protein
MPCHLEAQRRFAAAAPVSLRPCFSAVVAGADTADALPEACAGDGSSAAAPGGQQGAGASAGDTRHLGVTRPEMALRGNAPGTVASLRGSALRRRDGSETLMSLLPVATDVADKR